MDVLLAFGGALLAILLVGYFTMRSKSSDQEKPTGTSSLRFAGYLLLIFGFVVVVWIIVFYDQVIR